MAARDPAKGKEAVEFVKSQVPEEAAQGVAFLELDLSSFESIKSAAKTVVASSPRLNILILNAGCETLFFPFFLLPCAENNTIFIPNTY